MRKLMLSAAAAILAATSLFAADLGKFKDWTSEPVSYFMTSAERAEWGRLQTEAEAEQFVNRYLAARGGEKFQAEVAKRAQMADKYLSIGDKPGSKTMRGKIVILFGPPASMDVAVKRNRTGRTASMDTMMGMGSASGTGPTIGDVAETSAREGMSGGDIRIYTFTYMAANLPTKKDLTVAVEVSSSTGKDRIADKKAAAELEKVFDAAAQASIVAPAN